MHTISTVSESDIRIAITRARRLKGQLSFSLRQDTPSSVAANLVGLDGSHIVLHRKERERLDRIGCGSAPFRGTFRCEPHDAADPSPLVSILLPHLEAILVA